MNKTSLVSISLLSLLLALSFFSSKPLFAAPPLQAVAWGTLLIGDEVAGVAGPQPVNCLHPTYLNARTTLDAQRAAWVNTASTAIPNGIPLGSLIPGPTGTAVDAPLILQQPDGFVMTVTAVDLPADQGYGSRSVVMGTPSFANVQINGSPTGCTMQDNAPRASPAHAGDFYFNQLSNLRGLNGIHIRFSTPVQAFGAFFGDLETSLRGTTAFLRLLDANGALLDEVAIPSTLGQNGGVAAEDTQCNGSNVPDVDVAAQGLWPGCGNATTRWIGFVATVPVAQVLVVVGDNDPLPGGKGLTEKLSMMGPAVVRVLPPAEVTIAKSAPGVVTAESPFLYTLLVSNTSSNLAAGLLISDQAPVGIHFNAVIGEGCLLIDDLVTCQLASLPAASSRSILIQATTSSSTTLTNRVWLSATNDTDPNNNQASVHVTPLAAPPPNFCAPTAPLGNGSLVINEMLYRQTANNDEWVELYATAAIAANTQFYLSDNESSGFRYLLTAPPEGIPAGTYLVIHSLNGTLLNGVDDTSVSDGDGLEYFGSGDGSATYLNNSGDNISLYVGNSTSGTLIDAVLYGSGSAVNGPSLGIFTPTATSSVSIGQSIASLQDGADTQTGNEWVASGSNNTLGISTAGTDNRGKTICNIALRKSGPATAMLGEPFDYQLVVHNSSTVTVSQVIVSDTQPMGMTFNQVDGPGCNLNDGVVICAIGSLPPSASQTITLNATASLTQIIHNTAYTHALSDTAITDNQAEHSIQVLALGSIGDFIYLDEDGDGVVDAEENTPLNRVPVTLTLPDGSMMTTVSIDGLYHFANLPAGRYTVTVGNALGYLATSHTTHPLVLVMGEHYSQADFGFQYGVAGLALSKQGATIVTLGEAFAYSMTVSNLSETVMLIDALLTDTQPTGVRFDTVSDPRCGLLSGQLTCNLGNLAPLASTTVILTATAQNIGDWHNQAFATASNANTTTDSWLTVVRAAPIAALSIDKRLLQPATGVAHLGEAVQYALRIENRGEISITQLVVEDRYPAQSLLYHSALLAPTVQSNGILTWTLTGPSDSLPIAPGAVITITVNFTTTKP